MSANKDAMRTDFALLRRGASLLGHGWRAALQGCAAVRLQPHQDTRARCALDNFAGVCIPRLEKYLTDGVAHGARQRRKTGDGLCHAVYARTLEASIEVLAAGSHAASLL